MTPKLFIILSGFVAVVSCGFVIMLMIGKRLDKKIKEEEKKNYNGDVDWLLSLDEFEEKISQ